MGWDGLAEDHSHLLEGVPNLGPFAVDGEPGARLLFPLHVHHLEAAAELGRAAELESQARPVGDGVATVGQPVVGAVAVVLPLGAGRGQAEGQLDRMVGREEANGIGHGQGSPFGAKEKVPGTVTGDL
jgi:hypothetical protein